MLHRHLKRWVFLLFGLLSLVLGVIGIFLPLLPTTPLILLAAFFFSRSSEKFHQCLIQNPKLGPLIRDWNQYGVIRPKAKVMATMAIALAFCFPMFVIELAWYVRLVTALVLLGVLIFIWTRKSYPAKA